MVYRLVTLPLNKNDLLDELDTIKHFAMANGYKSHMVNKLLNKKQNNITRLLKKGDFQSK